jgi:hypothetical protein
MVETAGGTVDSATIMPSLTPFVTAMVDGEMVDIEEKDDVSSDNASSRADIAVGLDNVVVDAAADGVEVEDEEGKRGTGSK